MTLAPLKKQKQLKRVSWSLIIRALSNRVCIAQCYKMVNLRHLELKIILSIHSMSNFLLSKLPNWLVFRNFFKSICAKKKPKKRFLGVINRLISWYSLYILMNFTTKTNKRVFFSNIHQIKCGKPLLKYRFWRI